MEEEEERPAVTACGEGISSTTSGWSSFQETLGRMEREARACPAYTLALRIFAQHRMLESENDFLVGLEGLHLGASQGDADAAVVLGTLYREGIVVDEDVRRALACYRKGADLGHPMAMNDLALLYENGIEGVLQQDVAEAIRLYRLAAENGLHLALANLAGLYLDGAPGLSPDPEEALALFARAAARGCVSAMLSLADIYEEGDVVAQVGLSLAFPPSPHNPFPRLRIIRTCRKPLPVWSALSRSETPRLWGDWGACTWRAWAAPPIRKKRCR